MLEAIQSDPEQLKTVMRSFTSHSRNYPTLARDIIAIDGLGSESQEYWQAWKDAVLDLACDASDQSLLLTLIKRAVAALSGSKEGPRAVCILADLARIVPSSLELIIKHFEASFPYWKNPQSASQLQSFTRNALNLGAELPRLLERIIDFITRKMLLIDLSIRPEDVPFIAISDVDKLKLLGDAAARTSSPEPGNLTGAGEKYSQEEKAKELEEARLAHQKHAEQVQNYANKIDLMLVAFFEFIESAKATGSVRDVGLFVLISFEKAVLPAVKPKFTQFIMFYAAAVDNFVADRLLGSLLASLFSRDAQLSSTSQKNCTNSQTKAKALQATAAFLGSFVKKSRAFSDVQLKTVVELLSEWIGRKIEALTHFSNTPLELSILASVLETLLDIIRTHPHVSTNDPRLKQAIELCGNLLAPDLKSHEIFSKFFENDTTTVSEPLAPKKHHFAPFESLPLIHSRHIMVNAGIFSE